MARLGRGYARFLDGCGLLAGGLIAALAILVTVDVALRNFGITNLPWVIEVGEYALYGTTFLAAPWVLHQGAHVRVDFLLAVLPRAFARAAGSLMDGIGLAVSLTLLVYGFQATHASWRHGSIIVKELAVVEWPLLAILPLSAALLAIEFTRRLYSAARGAGGGGL
jgi:TRAP-type C4-dicarboxylate transport system permease small subunit